MIEVNALTHIFPNTPEDMPPALDGVTLSVAPGEHVAILGRNGCGKSTLAKHMNALLLPTSGSVCVDGMVTTDEEVTLSIRQ